MAQAQTAVLQADPAQDKATAAKPSNVRWRIFAIVFALTVINLVDRVSLSIAMPTIAGEFQLTPSMQGLILSSFFWAYALLQIPGGWLIDRYGPRRVIGWSTGLWGAFQTLAAFASGGLSLMFARVALGAAEAPLFPSGGKLNSLWLGSSERSRGAVLMDCGGPLGVALGGLVIAYLIAVLGSWRSAFFIAGIATLAMAWLAWHYLRDDPAEHPGVNAAELDRINADRTTPLAEADCQAGGRLEPVQPYVSADMVDTARELARRGLSELLMNVARSTQNTAWELWMKMAFNLTQDPRVLEEFLEVSSRSISEFIDSNMRVVTQIILEEKSAQAHDDPIDKRSLVSRLLEGRDVDTEQFGRRLGYSLFQKHYAGLVWCESPDAEIRLLEDVARTLAQLTGTAAPLIVFAGPATLWVWSHAAKPLDLNLLQGIALRFSGIRAAIGSPGTGVNGFRRSHLEALTTQRLMGRLAGAPAVATIDQVRMVSLMTQDDRAARQFVLSTLGRLATEPSVLQRSLHAFLANGCNVTQTAEALGTHRNTLLRRLERAQDLLPVRLADHRIQIAAALELVIWSTPLIDDDK